LDGCSIITDEGKGSEKAAKKIIIADDTLPLRVMLEDLLTDAGYEVQTASDGVEAWDLPQSPARFH